MRDQVFETEQVVSSPREAVFAFFAEPRNLEAITPPWLRFHLVGQTTARIERGTELTYRLRIHGLPATWRSRIEEWLPNERFVDVQLQGPYALWQHTHRFEDRGAATLIQDHVRYRLPLGRLGQWVGGRFVAADLRKIFAYRAGRTAELLSLRDRPTPACPKPA